MKKEQLATTNNNQQVAPVIMLTNNADPATAPSAPIANAPVDTASDFPAAKTRRPGLGFAITSFVLGIVGLLGIIVLGFFAFLGEILPYGIGIVAAVMGIIFAAIAKKKGDRSGFSTAGLVMSIVSLASVVLLIFTVASCFGCIGALIANA